jgi:hypothetical protein
LQIDLGRLGEWAVENAMKKDPGKSKTVSFTRALIKASISMYWMTKEFCKRAAANI